MAAKSLYLVFICVLRQELVCCEKLSSKREVTLYHNPGCNIPQCNSTIETSINLIYARAQGSTDCLHYILSTIGPAPPTLLLLSSVDVTATLKVNWTQLLFASGANLTGAVKLVSRVASGNNAVKSNVESIIIYDRVLEYNDSLDTAKISTGISFSPLLLDHLIWNVNISSARPSCLLMGTTSDYPRSFAPESSISMNFSPFGSDGQEHELPALPHNANSSDWDFVLNSLLSRGNGSRFAVELIFISNEKNLTKTEEKSIDDEYAPAAFTMEKIFWKNPANEKALKSGTFAQWRTVSYTSMNHKRKYSTDVVADDIKSVNRTSSQYKTDVSENPLLCAYFGEEHLKTLSAKYVVVSFGSPDDGFYAASSYLSWTASIGFGEPPTDSFSTLVICMLLTGVGCPTFVILAGGIYTIFLMTKRSRKSSFQNRLKTNYDYQPIQ